MSMAFTAFFCGVLSHSLANFIKRIHKPFMTRRISNKSSGIGGFLYRLRYRLGAYALSSFIITLGWLPDRLLVSAATSWAWITHKLLWKYRIRMEKNVADFYSDRIHGRAERKALVWRVWKNLTRGLFEAAALIHRSKEEIINTVRIEGEEHLRQALGLKRGVLVLSAHLGNFALIGVRLAAAGYPFSVVVKHPGDQQFAQLITKYRAQAGIETISAKPRREAVRGILRALRDNRIVLIIADEFKSGDVTVEFMGQKLPAPRGPATLALRTGAVTLPIFAIRQADCSIVLAIGSAIEAVQRDNLEETILATTSLYTRHLENAIRCYPDQWNWLGFPRKGRVARSPVLNPRPSTSESNTRQHAS
jgi:Kdo2-lipid IVA lauroyltransferase/acyltransferase